MKAAQEPPAEPPAPLELVAHLHEALASGQKTVADRNKPVTVAIPEELRPLPLDEGKRILGIQSLELSRLGVNLRERLSEILYAAIGTELGEYRRTGEARPNPELLGKLQETSRALQCRMALSVQAARLLRHYPGLANFLQIAAAPPSDLHPDWRPPEPGQLVPLTDPELSAQFNLTPITRPLEDLVKLLNKQQGRRTGRRLTRRVPQVLSPRPYAQGMRLVWDHAAKAISAAAAVTLALTSYCQTVVRTELGEAIRTGTANASAGIEHLVVPSGAMSCLVLEEGWNVAGYLFSHPTLDRLTAGF